MKKFLIAALATAITLPAFAAESAPTMTMPAGMSMPAASSAKFDNTKMKCGEKTLQNGDSTDSLTDICKGFKFGKGHAGFLDENSGKAVICQEKGGKLETSTCQPKPQQ